MTVNTDNDLKQNTNPLLQYKKKFIYGKTTLHNIQGQPVSLAFQ